MPIALPLSALAVRSVLGCSGKEQNRGKMSRVSCWRFKRGQKQRIRPTVRTALTSDTRVPVAHSPSTRKISFVPPSPVAQTSEMYCRSGWFSNAIQLRCMPSGDKSILSTAAITFRFSRCMRGRLRIAGGTSAVSKGASRSKSCASSGTTLASSRRRMSSSVERPSGALARRTIADSHQPADSRDAIVTPLSGSNGRPIRSHSLRHASALTTCSNSSLSTEASNSYGMLEFLLHTSLVISITSISGGTRARLMREAWKVR